MRYELIYLIGASKEAEQDEIKKNVEKVITDFSGIFEEDEWTEKRKLAYPINKDYQGAYFAKRFKLQEKENIAEINNQLRLLNQVSRFMIMKADELPEFNEMKEEKREDKKTPVKKDIQKKENNVQEKNVSQESKKNKNEEKPKNENIDKKLEEILNI